MAKRDPIVDRQDVADIERLPTLDAVLEYLLTRIEWSQRMFDPAQGIGGHAVEVPRLLRQLELGVRRAQTLAAER